MPVPWWSRFLAAAVAAAVLGAASASAQTAAAPEAALRAVTAAIVFPKGMLIAPDLAVSTWHSVANVPEGTEWRIGFEVRAIKNSRELASGTFLIRDEDKRRAVLVCASRAHDYAIWKILEPIPEDATWVPVNQDFTRGKWIPISPGNAAFRVDYTGRTSRAVWRPSAEFPEFWVHPARFRPVPGWSGSPIVTDQGELIGLVALGNEEGYVYPTIARWWTCHLKRR